jgi:hypothetical protein
MVKENSSKYGYATKEEVENIGKLVAHLTKEIEKLREELPAKKRQYGKRDKK